MLCDSETLQSQLCVSTSGLTSPGVKEEQQEPGQQGGGGPCSHGGESVQKMSELGCVHTQSLVLFF